MAQMFPTQLPEEVRTDPRRRAERLFFNQCKEQLAPEVVVVYSFRWQDPLDKRRALEGEADFTIIHPSRGILVLELKGGVIRREAATGKYYSRELRGPREYEIKDPAFQASNSRRAIINKLEASKPWRTWRQKDSLRLRAAFPATFGVVFPDCAADGQLIAGDITADNLIDASHLDALAQRIDAAFQRLIGNNACVPFNREAMDAILGVLAYDGTLKRPLSIEMAEEDRELLQATTQQLSILSLLRLQNRVLVRGGAGTGKTILAVEKAKRSAAQGRRTLLLCYNELLGDYLKKSDAAKAGAHVTTFHGLCQQLSGLKSGYSITDDQAAAKRYFNEELPTAAYERLIEQEPEQRYQTVVIDEAQDFQPTWYDIVDQLMEPDAAGEPPEYFIALDEDQLPPGRLNRMPEKLSPVQLEVNLRSTKAIFEATSSLRRDGALTCCGPEGEPPRKIPCASSDKLASTLEAEIDYYVDNGRVPTDAIVVLVGKSLSRSALALEGHAGKYRLASKPTAGAIQIESVWRFKGLERSVVILAEAEEIGNNRQSLYVGATRAKLRLSIVGTSPLLKQFK